jgi:putative phage-type endonuclease
MSTEKQIKEWHIWRNAGLGSSDAAVIMGHYDYKTPYQLWEEKTGKKPDKNNGNFATNKGNELEPIARAKYELKTGLSMPAGQYQHHEFEFLRATMDGYDVSLKRGIEIKYVGKDVFQSEEIPGKHIAQVQHQFIVTGAKQIDYVKISAEKEIKIIPCYPNQSYIMDYLKRAIIFWTLVQSDSPPELVDKDIRKIKGHDDIAKKYIEAKNILDKAQKDVEILKERISEITSDIAKAEFGKTGLTVVKSHRIGNIDYSKIEVLKDIDLEQYRKPSSSYIKLLVNT